MTAYIVKINWPAGGRETVPLGNPSTLAEGQRLKTFETSDGWDDFITYSTVIRSAESTEDGRYLIVLSYARADQAGTALQNEYWGTSTLEIDTSALRARATWSDDRRVAGYNASVDAELLAESQFSERLKRSSSAAIRDSEIAKQVRALDSTCAVTGETTRDVLDVAHILEIAHDGSDALSNCFLLRVDLHRLFDAGYLRFTDEGVACISPAADISDEYKLLLSNRRINSETYQRIRENLMVRMSKNSEN